jgi:hypothetical protein
MVRLADLGFRSTSHAALATTIAMVLRSLLHFGYNDAEFVPTCLVAKLLQMMLRVYPYLFVLLRSSRCCQA